MPTNEERESMSVNSSDNISDDLQEAMDRFQDNIDLEEAKARAKELHGVKKQEDYMTQEQYEQMQKSQAERQAELLAKFQFKDDDEEEEGLEQQPEWEDEQITEAVASIVDYVSKNMDLTHYDSLNWSLRVPVPDLVHPVVEERFSNRWSLDSRIQQFDRLRGAFEEAALHPDLKSKLDAKLLELFPTQGKIGTRGEGELVRDVYTQTPVGAWEVSHAILEDEDDFIIVEVDGEEAEKDSPVAVILELSKSAGSPDAIN